jgi:putative restriction endonuclease
VINAYRRQCAFCRFRHEELLDAAHIIPDRDPGGEPRIANGLALCALHHAAFDRFFSGLRPDLVIEVRPDLLREEDGPTRVHAIQGLHGTRIALPRATVHRPDPVLVEHRYRRFRESAASATS